MMPAEVRLEGFHCVKHALRFGATVHRILTDDREAVLSLVDALAPDIAELLVPRLELVEPRTMRELAPRAPVSPVLAFAESRPGVVSVMLRREGVAFADERPLVLLEDPRYVGNLGAVIRVAAAAGARGVLSTGGLDPWSAVALRGSAGLHYALEVAALEPAELELAELDPGVAAPPSNPLPSALSRQLIALDPRGSRLTPADLGGGPILAFGTERAGLSEGLLARADRVLALPMERGVSSLNLATAVSATLFAWRLARP